ncbi:7551_t:CDS:10 [Entrophospora sp. SA101]|nr:7551_t:CDS:10 [Entrophospora sp. SA101]
MEELIKTIGNGIITVGNDIIKQALGSEKEEQRFVDVEGFKQWNLEAPDVCCVCLEGATNVENILVYCDGRECEVICHQECYGITKLPAEEDPWYCDKCLAKPAEVVSCILCPKKTGAFRRLREEESFKTNAWVHLVCALWIPGMWIANTSELNECSIINVKQVNWKKECCICPKELASQGATVRCDAGSCRNWIHVTCAQAYNLLECVEDSEMADPYFVSCKDHGSQAGSLCLNEWERWILKRDTFLDKIRSEESQQRTYQLTSDDSSSWLIEQGKILREIFEDSYSEYQKRQEIQITKLKKSIAQSYSSYKQDKDNLDKAKKDIELLFQNTLTAKSETIELVKYFKKLILGVDMFVEKMIRKDIENSDIIDNKSDKKNNSTTNPIVNNGTNTNKTNQYTFIEYPTYKGAGNQMNEGIFMRALIEIRQLLTKLPNSISDWNSDSVEEAKAINVKRLGNFEGIEPLRLNNAQKSIDQRQKENKLKVNKNEKTITTHKTKAETNNNTNNNRYSNDASKSKNPRNTNNDNLKNIQQQVRSSSSSSTITNSKTLQLVDNLTNQLKKAYYTGKVPYTAARTRSIGPSVDNNNSDNGNGDYYDYEDDGNEDVFDDADNGEDGKDYGSFDSYNMNGYNSNNRPKIVYGNIFTALVDGDVSTSSTSYPQPTCSKCNKVEPPDHNQTSLFYAHFKKSSSTMIEKKGKDIINRMLRCNFCKKWNHLACMNPPIKTIPNGGFVWRCDECGPIDANAIDPLDELIAKGKHQLEQEGDNYNNCNLSKTPKRWKLREKARISYA